MKNSNNAKTIAQVQNHMVRQFGSKKKLYEEMDHLRRSYGGIHNALVMMVEGGDFLFYRKDIYNFLNRLGYTKAQLDKMDIYKRYTELIVRDGTRFYDAYTKTLRARRK